MTDGLRKSGIGAVGDIPWGTHFCHFYQNKGDLLDVLVPFFKTGLEQNEFCIWGVFDPLDEREARNALQRAIPGADERLAAGDIEIVPQSQWYGGDGPHDLRQLVRDWSAKLEKAMARGFAGMRVSVNPAWLAERARQNVAVYEDGFSRFVANRRILMPCAYPLAVDRAAEILDAGYTHRFAIARREGSWQVVETPELRHARAEVKQLHAELALRATERIRELAMAECYFGLGLVGMGIVSPTEGCIEVNDRLCDMLGYERGELMQMTWAGLTQPEDLASEIRNYDRILAGAVDGYLLPKRWIRKNGDAVQTNVSVNCHRRKDGSVDYFAAMVEEVTGLDRSVAIPGQPVLSGREREVTRLIGLGRTVKEVAAALQLSEKTVSTYRSRILTKLKLKSTAELIRYALKTGLAE